MDKYDRDVWRDAESIPLWLFLLIIVVLLGTIILGLTAIE